MILVLHAACAGEVAERFGLGDDARLNGPVAFGRLGEMWQLVTDQGRFAVKHTQFAASNADAELETTFQESVRRAGVPVPAVVRAADGSVVADVGGATVRVYEWVEVMPADRRLDPELGGCWQLSTRSMSLPTDPSTVGTSTRSVSRPGRSWSRA